MMLRGASSSVSAITAESIRLDVTADNVANVSTDGYRAKRVTNEATINGGIRARIDQPPPPPPSPTTLEADGRERVLSNVDVISETSSRVLAQRSFEANLKMLQTSDEMTKSVLSTKA
jgi:flagellar basal body rod protein FlgG